LEEGDIVSIESLERHCKLSFSSRRVCVLFLKNYLQRL
jgi:hypothetical protein